MIILDVNKVSKNFGFGQLFENISFSLNEGETISVVGPNGCGKSTLLKLIAGIERFDSGTINIKKDAKVAYLDQTSSSIKDDRKVYEILKDAFSNLNQMEERLSFLQSKLNENLSEDEYNQTLQRYCSLLEKFSLEGGYDIDVNISVVAQGLKIGKDLLEKPYTNLSGGEKTLVSLARELLRKPDLFLLDEPTNHLDIERIEWLENYIKSFKGAAVIVSHDRYFLDRMSNKILSLDGNKPKIFATNYSGYLKEREHDFEAQMAEYKDQQEAMKRLETQIKYFAERGMATNSSSLCDRAHSLQTQLDRMKKNAVEKPKQAKKLDVDFDRLRKSSKRVIEAKNLSICVPNGKTILDKMNLHICAGERVAIIGSNGSGKSTFLKTVMNVQDLPISGELFVGPSVKIGYLPQIIEFENEDQKLLDCFREEACVHEETARKILANFQFYKDDVDKKVKNLSGGEKIRVKLALLLQQKINTLIFDEPTNHIDIPTKEVLEDALEKFDGTLIFVSHDRYFINKFANRTIEFENGHATSYLDGYDYYKTEKTKKKNV